MSELSEELPWALHSLAHAGCYDEFSPGPDFRTMSDRGYRRASKRFEDLIGDLE